MSNLGNHGIALATDEIIIETVNGRRIALEAVPDWTIQTYKEKIKEKIATSVDYQRLYIVGKRFEDGSYLYKTEMKQEKVKASAYGVQRGSLLLLRIMIPIQIETLTGQIITLEVETSDTIQVVKDKLYEHLGIPSAKLHLLLPSTELVEGRPLFNVHLENIRTLLDYQIQAGTKITLAIQVQIRSATDRIVSLVLQPSDTIQKLKAEIQDQLGIMPGRQFLIFSPKSSSKRSVEGNTLEKDNNTLSDYGIEEGSLLDLSIKVTAKIYRLSDVVMGVKLTDTIEKVQLRTKSMKICWGDYEVGGKTRLMYEGKELENHLTVAECGIQWESVIQIHYVMKIFVTVLDNKEKLSVYVHETDTVENLKLKIFKIEGTPVDAQRLVCAGKQMEESRTLLTYQIKAESRIHLIKRQRGC